MRDAMPSEPRSALVLLVPEADPVVGGVRLTHDPLARAGLGAHVTLLFPFAPALRIDDDLLARLREQFSRAPDIAGAIELRFDRLARFPGVAYLALADPERVVLKIRALAAAWPEYPPYEGRFSDIVPHLTVAHGDEQALASAEAELNAALPIVATVRFASLFLGDDDGRWREHARFPLFPSPAGGRGSG
jgi:2'-5' RNA ligase